jgi:pimeloyl-ACP methyl ester carboxylesterase
VTEALAYTDAGDGPPVVLLHGLTCHLGYWQRVIPLLEGLRVVALDFGGHGLSAHRDSYPYVAYQRDLLGLLGALDLERVTVAGHSLGGYVALLAASRSDRIGPVLAIDVKSDWTGEDGELAERSRGASQRVEADREVLLGRLAKSVAPAVLDRDELDVLAERSIEPFEGGWRFRWDRRVLDTEPVVPFAFLAGVRCRAHVIAGAQSNVMPPDKARPFAEAMPVGALELAPGAGHHVELEAADLIATRILELTRDG